MAINDLKLSSGMSATRAQDARLGPGGVPLTAHPLAQGLTGTCTVPGDKSISHRAMMFAALALGKSTVYNLLESEDVLATARAMEALGACVLRDSDGIWSVHGMGVGGLLEPLGPLDFGNAGTGSRLCMGLVMGSQISCHFMGDASLSSRPMNRILAPLRQMGAQVKTAPGERLPITLQGPDMVLPIDYCVPMPSAQVKSAVLLAALSSPGTTSVTEPVMTRDHTERMLESFGADIHVETSSCGQRNIRLHGQHELVPQTIQVPADPSSAAFVLVGAAITPGSHVTVENVLLNKTRSGLLDCLIEMGAKLQIDNHRIMGGETVGDISVSHAPLKGITVAAERAPFMIDEYPILAVAAAFASGETRMLGLDELRVKECDRLAVTARALSENGVLCKQGHNWLSVSGGDGTVKGGGHVRAHMDHRIAMSFLVMGLGADRPITVDDTTHIATSFPNFTELMQTLGAIFEPHIPELGEK